MQRCWRPVIDCFKRWEPKWKFRLDRPQSRNDAARHQAESIFAKWYDIQDHKNGNRFITVYDSTFDVFKDPELKWLQNFSRLLRFPAQPQSFMELLTT